MALPWIADQTVERLRAPSVTNGYGDAGAPNWNGTLNTLPVEGCSVQPEQGPEFLDNRTAVVSRWRFFGPYDADILSNDRIRHDSITYQIDGSVQKWDDPTAMGLDHLTCLLRKTS